MPSHVDLISSTGSPGQVSGQKTYTADAEFVLDISVPAPSTDLEVDVAIDVSNVKSLCLLADRDMTIETNSAGSPVDTIALKASVPYLWNTDSYSTLLLTVDVTKFFLTLAAGAAATLKIRCLIDSTP